MRTTYQHSPEISQEHVIRPPWLLTRLLRVLKVAKGTRPLTAPKDIATPYHENRRQKYIFLYIKTLLNNQDFCILFCLEITWVYKNYSLIYSI